MAASTFGLTLEDVKAFLGYATLDTKRDAVLTALLYATLGALRIYTGRRLDYGTYRDTLHTFPQKIYLRETPVTRLHSVRDDIHELAHTDFKLFPETGLIDFKWQRPFYGGSRYGWADLNGYAVIEYVAGHPTLPGDMLLAVMAAIQAADTAQKHSLLYGGPLKRLTVYDVGVQEFANPSSIAVINDTLAAQLASYQADGGYAIGTPNLHESEYLGPAALFSPSELFV